MLEFNCKIYSYYYYSKSFYSYIFGLKLSFSSLRKPMVATASEVLACC